MVLKYFGGTIQNVASSACPESPFLGHDYEEKNLHFFVKMALKYFLGPIQNAASSACPESPFLCQECEEKKI